MTNEGHGKQNQMNKDDAMNTMNPSDTKPTAPMTAGQIGKIEDLLAAGLRKANLPSEAAQTVIEHNGKALVEKLVEVVRKFVEDASDMISCIVKVDRNRTPQEVLKATCRNLYATDDVVTHMPKGEGDETEVIFFKVGRWLTNEELAQEYELRGLKPADPYSQAKVNEDDPAFADERPNGTHWKHNGKWCYAAFFRWRVGRGVLVGYDGNGWNDDWWFAGVCKLELGN